MKGTIVKALLIWLLSLILSGCCTGECIDKHKEADIANAHLILDKNGLVHLFYNTQLFNYKGAHHLKTANGEWVESNDLDLNEEVVTAFNKDNNICLLTFNRFEEKEYRIACIESNETVIYPCDTNISFGGYEDVYSSKGYFVRKNNIYVFLPEGYFVRVDNGYFYKYDPFSKKDTKLFEAPFSEKLDTEMDFFPYVDTNGSWDGRSFIYYNSETVELVYVDDNMQGHSLDVTAYGIEDEIYNNRAYSPHKRLYPYVIVKDKFYNMPVEGKIVAISNDSLLIDDANTYFGDRNLALLGVHDVVEEDGTFHHLDNYYSNSSEVSRLTYEQYIPSQSDPVKSEIFFYHKVKN